MADENTPAFYPRVGNIRRKDFKPAKPMPFIDDKRAMELPDYKEFIPKLGTVDLSVPSKENRELNRRITERDADLMRQVQADRSPLEKLAGGLQAGRFLGSALTQGINAIPTQLFSEGTKAEREAKAEKFIQDRLYKPEQPVAYEYAGDIGDFLEKLETQYKIPPVLPEAMALQYLTGPAASQAARATGRGAEQVGRKLESAMEPVVKGALEQGGLPREMVMAMGANTQSNVIKPYGGNWLGGGEQLGIPENDLRRLKRNTAGGNDPVVMLRHMNERYTPEALANMQEGSRRFTTESIEQLEKDVAVNKWIDSNLKNYVKKEMGTRDDPVRKLAEEGIIHTPLRNDLDRMEYLQDIRKAEGYPAEGMGKSDLAKQWENLSDDAIRVSKAGNIQEQANIGAKLEKARAELDAHKKQIDEDFIAYLQRLGGLDIKDREVFDKMPNSQKAGILGDTKKLSELQMNVNNLLDQQHGFEKRAGELNPFVAKLDPETRLYSGSTYDLGFDHIVDVLKEDVAAGRIRPEQLNKVSMEQAVRRTYEYDQELARKMAEARMTSRAELPVYKEYPEGLKWVELNRPGDFAMESDAMGHSVRGYEPPKGSADWTEGSGESGYGGYGLGGWEAIKKGKAKVYSLIDAKGEPHVTIEVGAYPDQLRAGNLKPYTQAAIEEAKLLPNGYTDADVRDIEIRMAKENMPKYINQIKGKQNAKPKDEYLPFVQDFVRGGNWSDVRDFQNTNLISADQVRKAGWDMSGVTQKYFTKQEYDDFMRAEQKRVEGDGMKAGGKVSISNNPDTMMLELGNRRMKAGGVVRMAGGGDPSKRLSGNILAGASWNSLNQTLGNQLTQLNGMPTFNTSVGGATTADTYKQLMDFIDSGGSFDSNAIVYLQTGGVDFLNGVPKDQIANNIDQILTILENQGVDVVLTGAPFATSMDDVVSNNFDPTMDPLFQEVASKHQNVALVGSMGDILQDKSLLSDNLHTNEQGTIRYNNDVIGALAQFTQPNVNVVNTVNTPNTVITDNATNNLDQSNTLQGGLSTPAITPATTPNTQTQVLGDAVTTPVTSDTSDTSATLSTPVTSSPLSNVATAQTLTTPAVLSTPDYSKSYDALGGPDVANDLRDQFLGMGMDEDTIGSVFSKYYSQDNPTELKKGGEVHMAKGGLKGALNIGLKAAKPPKIDVPIRFPVSRGPTVPEIRAMAERMAPQVMGEFVRAAPTPSKPNPSESVVGKSRKQFEREKTLPIEYENIKEPVTPEEFDYAKKKGALLIGAQGDVTPGNRMLISIDNQPLSAPVHMQAGPEWELYNPSAWAATDQMAKTWMKRAKKASEEYEADPYLHYHKMTPDANWYAMHHFNSVLGHLRPEELKLRDPKLYQEMLEEIRTKDVGFGKHPEFEGFDDPLNLQIHAQMDPNFRRHIGAIFGGPKFTTRYGLNSGQDVLAATSLPELRDLEAGASGYAVVPLDVNAPLRNFEADSQTYDTGFPKAGASGRSKYPSPYQLIYRDTLNWMKDVPSDKKSSEFGRMNMIVPKQQIDNELIEAIGEYQRRMKELTGKKKGGAVKKAEGGYLKKLAAYINGDEFVNAAKKYGIKDSMNNLNKIVDLVNKGLSVDDAARQVSDSGMHKAAGGAIRGDDLILEERPL